MEVRASRFHIYSVCLVAEDNEEDNPVIECFPVETITQLDGDIAEIKTVTGTATDIEGEVDTISIEKRNTVKATWINLSATNRITPPNVKKGEQILVYRFANTDQFFWQTMYHELDLRRTEKVINYYGNTEVFKEELNDDNTYWTKIDTINKVVHNHTSDNDGEFTTYDFQINTKDGRMIFIDGEENFIELDSPSNTLTVTTNEQIITNTVDTIHNSSATITENTGDSYENIDNNKEIVLKKIKIENDAAELIDLMVQHLQANMEVNHLVLNVIPTFISPWSKAQLLLIKTLVETFQIK